MTLIPHKRFNANNIATNYKQQKNNISYEREH